MEDALKLLSSADAKEIFSRLERERAQQREAFEHKWLSLWEEFASGSEPTLWDVASFRLNREADWPDFEAHSKGPLTDLFEICEILSQEKPPELTQDAKDCLEYLKELGLSPRDLPLDKEVIKQLETKETQEEDFLS